jgi:hypothetical protein
MKEYVPRGLIVPFIEAVKKDPDRSFTVSETLRLVGVKSNKLGGSLTYALRNGVVFRAKIDGKVVYRGKPFDAAVAMNPPPKPPTTIARRLRGKTQDAWTPDLDDIRIPKVVPGWVPPKMVCPRAPA